MAVTEVPHKPGLTVDQVKEAFRQRFEGKYKIEDFKGPLVGARRDFVVVKNALVGVGVKLEQGEGETKFVYAGIAPRMWARILFTGLISLFLWNGLTNEVKEFIETAPEFR